MDVTSLFGSKHDITPDPNNANNHCGVCQRTFKVKRPYLIHLKVFHNMDVSSILKPKEHISIPKPSSNAKNRCVCCNYIFSCEGHFDAHLNKIHHTPILLPKGPKPNQLEMCEGDCARPKDNNIICGSKSSDFTSIPHGTP